jgi:hypothetical protein
MYHCIAIEPIIGPRKSQAIHTLYIWVSEKISWMTTCDAPWAEKSWVCRILEIPIIQVSIREAPLGRGNLLQNIPNAHRPCKLHNTLHRNKHINKTVFYSIPTTHPDRNHHSHNTILLPKHLHKPPKQMALLASSTSEWIEIIKASLLEVRCVVIVSEGRELIVFELRSAVGCPDERVQIVEEYKGHERGGLLRMGCSRVL